MELSIAFSHLGISANKSVHKVITIVVNPVSLLIPVFDSWTKASFNKLLLHRLYICLNVEVGTERRHILAHSSVCLLHTREL